METTSPPILDGSDERKVSHPTHAKLLNSAIVLMQIHDPEEISTEMVLKHSRVSRGSLYYHFRDLADLLETALVRSFSKVVDDNIAFMGELIRGCANDTDFYHATLAFNDSVHNDDRREARLSRIRLFGLAARNPRMLEKLEQEQTRLTKGYVALFETAQERGWMARDFDPLAAAVLVQAYTIGKVVDDISTERVDLDQWKSLLMKLVVRVFGVSPNPKE